MDEEAASTGERGAEPRELLAPAALPTWFSLLVAVVLLVPAWLWYHRWRGDAER